MENRYSLVSVDFNLLLGSDLLFCWLFLLLLALLVDFGLLSANKAQISRLLVQFIVPILFLTLLMILNMLSSTHLSHLSQPTHLSSS